MPSLVGSEMCIRDRIINLEINRTCVYLYWKKIENLLLRQGKDRYIMCIRRERNFKYISSLRLENKWIIIVFFAVYDQCMIQISDGFYFAGYCLVVFLHDINTVHKTRCSNGYRLKKKNN